MFNNIKDSLIEKMLNKIIDEKEIKINAKLVPNDTQTVVSGMMKDKLNIGDILLSNEVEVKVSFGGKD